MVLSNPFYLYRRKLFSFVTELMHINRILTMSKKTLVIGASSKEMRYSNMVIKKLVVNNHIVKAIGLRSGIVSGVPITPINSKEFLQKLVLKNIHTVTLYINSKRQNTYYNYIVSLQPKRVIFNPGTENEEFYAVLTKNKIHFEVACTLALLNTKQY